MIQVFSLSHGSFWFLDMTLTSDEHLFLENISGVDRELHRSKEDFIKEHFKKYNKPAFPPAWKTLEVVSFGALSKMYYNFKDTKAKKTIARSFGLPQHVIFESWIASIAALRNCCAHHARLWNRTFPVTPTLPDKLKGLWISDMAVPANKLYAQLCCIAYLTNNIHPVKNNFTTELKSLIAAYPNVDVLSMGFPKDWKSQQLWK